MVIRALDIVDRCYSNADGQQVFEVVYDRLKRGEAVTVSFEGVSTVPSSFVNTAFITLLDYFPFEKIRRVLTFTKTTPQINEMIRSRFAFEAQRKPA
ncbi:STAS-like domain-containing protein [Burkholderia multivorans]|nr:STAS-like domain-containing protein [Burkholderia multivorans]